MTFQKVHNLIEKKGEFLPWLSHLAPFLVGNWIQFWPSNKMRNKTVKGANSDVSLCRPIVMLLWRKQSFCWKPVWSSPKWDLPPCSCSVCRLVSRTVKSALLPELRMLKAEAAASSWGCHVLGRFSLSLSNHGYWPGVYINQEID